MAGRVISQLTSIVARGANGAIGAKNRLPWRVKADMRFFRETTVRNVVVMGKRTFGSLDGCLPNRHNVVVTHGFELFDSLPDCEPAGSIAEALVRAGRAAGSAKQVFIVGGATMYAQFADLVDRYLLTDIRIDVPDADTFFDAALLGAPERWTRTVLASGSADADGNDAAFEIVEWVSKDAVEIAERRRRVMEGWGGNLTQKPRAPRRPARSGETYALPL